MSVDDLLQQCLEQGVRLTLEGEQVRFRGPRGALSDSLLEALRTHRDGIAEALRTEEPEVRRRAALMTFRRDPTRAINVLHLPGAPSGLGLCVSCGAALGPRAFSRCRVCTLAVELALRSMHPP